MSLVVKNTSKPSCLPRQHQFQYQLLVNECLQTKLSLMQMRKNYRCIEADACVQKCERERAKVRVHWFCCGNRNSFFSWVVVTLLQQFRLMEWTLYRKLSDCCCCRCCCCCCCCCRRCCRCCCCCCGFLRFLLTLIVDWKKEVSAAAAAANYQNTWFVWITSTCDIAGERKREKVRKEKRDRERERVNEREH